MKNINKIIGILITTAMLIVVEYINIYQWENKIIDMLLTIAAITICGITIYYFITLVILRRGK